MNTIDKPLNGEGQTAVMHPFEGRETLIELDDTSNVEVGQKLRIGNLPGTYKVTRITDEGFYIKHFTGNPKKVSSH